MSQLTYATADTGNDTGVHGSIRIPCVLDTYMVHNQYHSLSQDSKFHLKTTPSDFLFADFKP